MKSVIFLLAFGYCCSALSTDIQTQVQAVSAENIEKIISPAKDKQNNVLPAAAVFIKDGAIAPTCALIGEGSAVTEIIGPEGRDRFPTCRNIDRSASFLWSSSYYVVFMLTIEDPRAVFTRSFQLVKIGKNGFFKCQNDLELSGIISTRFKKSPKEAARLALNAVGCRN